MRHEPSPLAPRAMHALLEGLTMLTIVAVSLASVACHRVASPEATELPVADGPTQSKPSPGNASPAPSLSLSPPASARPAPDDASEPVVIELFSSEGCSSCPSAEIVLRELEAGVTTSQPPLILLEQHVDYWNGLGWADPFSKAAFSERQKMYSARLRHNGVYTPQAIVNGRTDVVGSDREGLSARVREARASSSPRAKLSLLREAGELVLNVARAPESPSELRLFTVESGLVTRVLHGENQGRTLAHGPVVRELVSLGPVRLGTPLRLARPKRDRVRYVVTVADASSWAILGAAIVD